MCAAQGLDLSAVRFVLESRVPRTMIRDRDAHLKPHVPIGGTADDSPSVGRLVDHEQAPTGAIQGGLGERNARLELTAAIDHLDANGVILGADLEADPIRRTESCVPGAVGDEFARQQLQDFEAH
jgi:hypothetical protein